ncbi:MAG: 50S ribosomal protein L4 [Endomicrobium sp.]|jgi:large subunit ribosomal protein L4|nr:50S ribosomal protein L4 [Endomicrobium sp.]
MSMMKNVVLYDINGSKQQVDLQMPSFVTIQKISKSLLYEVLTTYLNNQRAGTHKVKTRGEVAFSGAKPWKQKGTGKARAGQKNSPLWRKGGVIFGPQPKDYYINISKNKRQQALKMALSMQFKNDNILAVNLPESFSCKTKIIFNLIKKLNIVNKKIIFLILNNNITLKNASNNINNVLVYCVKNINAYKVLWADKLIISSTVLTYLNEIYKL